jgi:hypothetical protein
MITSAQSGWEWLRSIRVRLTLWYVVLLGIILIAFSVFLYTNLARNLRAGADDSLASEAQRVVASLDIEDGPLALDGTPDGMPAGTVAALYDANGQRVFATDSRAIQPLPD